MKILVLGASGMLGSAVYRLLSESNSFNVIGTLRSDRYRSFFPQHLQERLISGVDVENPDCLNRVFGEVFPDIVINCIGLVKQLAEANDPLSAVPINSLLPHRLARLCAIAGARFVHMSTDCVFSGSKGMYTEDDFPDATDLYGRSKFLGEVDYPNAITLRTSIIGHELDGAKSLVDWFLSQKDYVKGYRGAVFSGLPTVEISRLIRDYVLPNSHLHGVYHVSADPINKHALLRLIANIYEKPIAIQADDSFVIDRSLDSLRFRTITGFQPKTWEALIRSMKDFG